MKFSILLVSFLLFSGPKIEFSETKYDFGKQKLRAKVEHSFSFENKGDAPLVITSHETSCHCTSAHYSPEPIMPGDKGEVVVKYDATKVGVFYRKVTIYTNAGKEVLTVKGEIEKTKEKVNPITGE